ncbi:uncharacterized protein BO95DRAFT_458528 [Aspergillus brunneoviolaceus CBS 621.78]|uniref:Uncharacterized protein n=1 Tax=Aspergillus brunneoviolaceus CBS 621.78 TaxID=1450534 RepID=A0ACD1GPG9_9EURO|nr:hypothetical protein BO95DRAFT_458528 [Aspergillus brunneoviolaceus CBS 621.78]RAH51174.1 hypothetical protein BO95DRAFT_458528 [Aspergillus brunneoviolaceus CBS 621.78]
MVRDLDLQPSYPIEPKPYIPGPIRFFQEQMGLAALQVEVNSIAYHLRSSWIRHALTDPCLFHTTLYTASAEMDAMRGTQGTTTNYATLYHQTNTIRLLNRRLVHGGLMDDATIASVLLLVISGSIEKDPDATEAHRQGLLRMVALRGGLKQLEFDGILAEMIEMNMVLPMVVFGQTDSALPAPVSPAEALPDSLPSLALARLRRGGSRINPTLQSQLLRVLEHIQDLFHALVQPSESSNLWALLDNGPPTVEFTTTGESTWSSSETSFLRPCQLSMTLLRTLADPSLPWHPDTIAVLLRDLNTSIAQTDPATRPRYAPEASLWATALGMAVSPDVHGRLTFLINERCVVLAVSNSKTTALHELFLDCYCWLRALVELRQPPALSPLPSTPPSLPFPLE